MALASLKAPVFFIISLASFIRLRIKSAFPAISPKTALTLAPFTPTSSISDAISSKLFPAFNFSANLTKASNGLLSNNF